MNASVATNTLSKKIVKHKRPLFLTWLQTQPHRPPISLQNSYMLVSRYFFLWLGAFLLASIKTCSSRNVFSSLSLSLIIDTKNLSCRNVSEKELRSCQDVCWSLDNIIFTHACSNAGLAPQTFMLNYLQLFARLPSIPGKDLMFFLDFLSASCSLWFYHIRKRWSQLHYVFLVTVSFVLGFKPITGSSQPSMDSWEHQNFACDLSPQWQLCCLFAHWRHWAKLKVA